MENNRNQILHKLPSESEVLDDQDNLQNLRQVAKDKKLAKEDPQRYCADRCVATGNCDVYEDIFDLSPQQVLAFCKECVLSEDKDECQIPEAFYEFADEDDVNNVLSP
jgi:hypothetical protein